MKFPSGRGSSQWRAAYDSQPYGASSGKSVSSSDVQKQMIEHSQTDFDSGVLTALFSILSRLDVEVPSLAEKK